jgi:hypothetical protein
MSTDEAATRALCKLTTQQLPVQHSCWHVPVAGLGLELGKLKANIYLLIQLLACTTWDLHCLLRTL